MNRYLVLFVTFIILWVVWFGTAFSDPQGSYRFILGIVSLIYTFVLLPVYFWIDGKKSVTNKENKIRLFYRTLFSISVLVLAIIFIVNTLSLLWSLNSLNDVNKKLDTFSLDSEYNSVAFDEVDSRYCEKIIDTNLSDNCFSNVAIKSGNAQLCRSIEDSEDLYSCVQAVRGDFSFCNKMNYSSSCFSRMATLTDNPDLCLLATEINDPDLASTLAYFGYIKKGESYEDAVKRYIEDHQSQATTYCYIGFGKRKQNASFCSSMLDKDYNNWCMAVATRNYGYCDIILDSKRGDMCYGDVVELTGTVLLCQKVIEPYERKDCVINAALFNNNPSDCMILDSQTDRDYCKDYLAYRKKMESQITK